jgi:hypothetical protein
VTGRRDNGQGTKPRPHAKGGFYQQVRLGGKRHTFYGATPTEVRAKVKDAVARQEAGAPVRDARATVAKFLTEWAEGPLQRSKRAENTKDQYESLLRVHAIPRIGQRALGSLTGSHVENMLADLMEGDDPVAVVLPVALRGAQRGHEDRRPRQADQGQPPGRGGPAGPPAQGGGLPLAGAGQGPCRGRGVRPPALRLHHGAAADRRSARRGLGFAFDHLTEDGTLHICQQVIRSKRKGLHLAPVKTDESDRYVSLTEPLAEVIRRRRKAQLEARMAAPVGTWTETGLMFTTALGTPLEPRNINRRFTAAVKRAGLPATVHIHTLRHSAVAFLIAAGVPMKVIQALMGHSSIQVTMDLYGHVAPEVAAEASEALGDVISGL